MKGGWRACNRGNRRGRSRERTEMIIKKIIKTIAFSIGRILGAFEVNSKLIDTETDHGILVCRVYRVRDENQNWYEISPILSQSPTMIDIMIEIMEITLINSYVCFTICMVCRGIEREQRREDVWMSIWRLWKGKSRCCLHVLQPNFNGIYSTYSQCKVIKSHYLRCSNFCFRLCVLSSFPFFPILLL